MEIVFWMIVAMFVIAVVYALSFRKRKALGREPSKSDVAPDTKGHGIDLQARRKTFDDLT